MKGIVVRSTGSWYEVRLESGEIIDCRIRGQFRIKGIKSTNPIAVGDQVHVLIDEKTNQGVIKEIEDRKNYVIRKATKLSKQTHIIAANLDQAIVMATLAQPRTSTGFIDRFLVTCEAYEIPATIVFNKTDIYNEEQLHMLDELISLYRKIGYPCIETSAVKKEGVDELKHLMKDKTSLITGHSGVGKSSIINVLDHNLELKIGDISTVHQKGKHTTTFATMHELSFGGFIIDTPGIKEFGMVEMEKEEISHYFPEIMGRLPECKFYNCTHVNEPKCAVIEAVKNGEIAESRYKNYLGILDSLE